MSIRISIVARSLRFCVATLLLFVVSVAAKAWDFASTNNSGTFIYYNILSSTDRTCEVTYYSSSSYTGSVDIPQTTLGSGAVYYTVISIDGSAFQNCTGLTSVTIPNSVTEIGSSAFSGCTGLTEITIPESVTEIGDNAFEYCTGLTEVNFNATACTSAGSPHYIRAFYGCENISDVNFGDDVTIIPDYLCYGLSCLTEVTIPESVTSIGEQAFYGCSGLTQFEVAEDNECYCSVEGVLYSKDMTTLIQFPAASAVTSYKIPNSVTLIGAYAFYYCTGLTEVTIPESVTEIGSSAFYGCTALESITSLNPEPPTCYNSSVFYNVPTSTCILYVPKGSLEAYSTASQWKDFLNIEEIVYPTKVQTYEATEVAYSSALLRGVVTVEEDEVLEQGFEYWAEGGDAQTITSPDLIMAVTLTGLESGVTYTYRAYAVTESYTVYGEEMTFTTLKAPTVQTYEVTEITESSALLKGFVTAGNEDVLGQGLEYWAAGSEIQIIAMSDQLMAVTVTGLLSGTTYTCRAYAITVSGTTYGEEVSFTTLGTVAVTPPTVLTYEVTEITESSALLKGLVTAGSEDVLDQGFEYWAEGGDEQTVTSPDLIMAVTVTGLLSGTTYTCRAYAITESGTTYGEEVLFTTLESIDGVSGVNADLAEVARYTTDGKKTSQPRRGMNVVVYSNGTVKKVLVK